MRVGIDVGGTHTDAVLLNGNQVEASTKSLTTHDVISGICSALDTVITATQEVKAQAIEAGADANTLKVFDVEETVIPYMDDGNCRVRVKVIGEIGELNQHGGRG